MCKIDENSIEYDLILFILQELEDLQNASADIHEDLRKWMLRRNYESLKEVSEYLHKTLQEHMPSSTSNNENSTLNVDASNAVAKQGNQSTDLKKSAAKRSLKNMQSKALAGLVIRKNITQLQKNNNEKKR